LLKIIKRLWELPPSEAAYKIKRRLLGRSGSFDVQEIIRSPRLMRSQRFYDFLSRYETILARNVGWEPLEFEGRDVLEIGCGSLLGFGPIALFRGAASYTAMEPGFDPCVFDEPAIVDAYYLSIFKDLSAIYGPRMEFPEFMDLLKTRTRVDREPLLETKLTGPFDIVLSNSCLEHVFDFKESMAALHTLCAADCRFLHLVDFSNHRSTKSLFADLYSMEPKRYLERFDDAINLLRPPDVLASMREVGFDAGLVPYASFREFFEGPVHEYWTEKYSEDELFLANVLIYGPTT
jgi:hypothetical protein